MTNFFMLITAFINPADSASVFKSGAQRAESIADDQKFWLIDKLWHIFVDWGISPRVADLITFIIAAAALISIVWLVYFVQNQATKIYTRKHQIDKRNSIDYILTENKFYIRIIQIIPLIIILSISSIIFRGFNETVILYVQLVTYATLTIVVLLTVYSVLNTWATVYALQPRETKRTIKGYIQVAKIILGFIAGVIIISIMVQKDPSTLFVGLGATAALFSLVFKDTILGFVASIQLSAQDMVRPGDWIEMPSKNADGMVLDINVNSVKVQNWDNTITMIPIYSMVSESFTNWRGMEQSEGRRFVRHFFIDVDSIGFASEELKERLAKNPVTAATFAQTKTLAIRINPSEVLTNLALLRSHLEIYLQEHPKINDELTLYVRYMQDITDKGVGLEIYAFSVDKSAQNFDAVHRSVVEYVLACAPLFDIALFQAPSGKDFRRL